MVTAYVLIQTEMGKAGEVAKAVLDVRGVRSAEGVTGPYDVIALTEARNVDDLGRLVVEDVPSSVELRWRPHDVQAASIS